ncbi:MAG: bifunctional glycosyltransferase family 2/GtrA family protein [Bacilli bacterium]|nr:bifunctional glycosyltransferase family 2/GtrA family protein [Bacilli bacterium]
MKDIFVIVPTLNPNKEILDKFLEKLTKEFENVLVYDDGCREEYQDYFKQMEKKGITVLHHYVNLGKGRAMKDAFNYLLNEYPDLKGVVTADSDGQHSVKDIKKCAKEVLKHQDSLILGCRNFDAAHVPARNRFGNKTTRNVLKLFVGVGVTDTQTGLRGLSKEVMIKFLTTQGDRFEYETNQLIDTISKEVPIKEIEIETIYVNGNTESHFNPIKDSLAIYKLFIKYIFASLSSFIIDIVLFALFNKVIPGASSILIATIIARVISSVYNYLMNANMVFKTKNKSSFIKYVILCVIQMFVSGYSSQYLAKLFTNINVVVIKLIVDMIIFVINFIIQREFIFVRKKYEK